MALNTGFSVKMEREKCFFYYPDEGQLLGILPGWGGKKAWSHQEMRRLREGCERVPNIRFLLQLPSFGGWNSFYHICTVPLIKCLLTEFIKEDLEIGQPFKYSEIVIIWKRNYWGFL